MPQDRSRVTDVGRIQDPLQSFFGLGDEQVNLVSTISDRHVGRRRLGLHGGRRLGFVVQHGIARAGQAFHKVLEPACCRGLPGDRCTTFGTASFAGRCGTSDTSAGSGQTGRTPVLPRQFLELLFSLALHKTTSFDVRVDETFTRRVLVRLSLVGFFQSQESGDGGAAAVSVVFRGYLGYASVDSVESLIHQVRDRGRLIGDEGIKQVFVEVLTTPFRGMFTGMPAAVPSANDN